MCTARSGSSGYGLLFRIPASVFRRRRGIKIFEAFYTVNRDRSRASGGTGLGLSLVRNLVEKQGGTIALLESSGEGAAFELSFPLVS
ncbi:ATP-binding protein [Paenibacillus rhizoplanae]